MPIISVFFGITIRMYFGDHPPPHIHVVYQGHEALIAISDGSLVAGSLPVRARRLVDDWIELRRDAIIDNWRRAERLEPLERIEGLD
ncbi:MAG: DUF4160 domain-containing protein [Alphaproteobacteria bacterium]|nr:DUF4160 domain-containing protein [Alphaproteobacteria bacterium]